MALKSISLPFSGQIRKVRERFQTSPGFLLGKTLEGFQPFLFQQWQALYKEPLLVIYAQEEAMESTYRALEALQTDVLRYPSLEVAFGEKAPSDSALRAERLSTLWKIRNSSSPLVLTTLKALLQYTPGPDFLTSTLILEEKEEVSWEKIISFLSSSGYTRTSRVEELGQYSVHGGILDVFLPNYSYPVRLEFSGETLESLRFFDPASQISRQEIPNVTLFPWRLFKIEENALRRLEDYSQTYLVSLKKEGKKAEATLLEEALTRDLNFLREGVYFLEEDYYFPFFSPSFFFWDHFPQRPVIFAEEEGKLRGVYHELDRSWENYRQSVKRGEQLPYLDGVWNLKSPEGQLPDWDALWETMKSNLITFSPFSSQFELDLEGVPPLSQYSDLLTQLKLWKSQGKKIFFIGKGANRYKQALTDDGFQIEKIEGLPEDLSPEVLYWWDLPLSSGFSFPGENLVFLSDFELFGWRKKPGAERKYKTHALSSWKELTPGNLVVHQNYGIGRYQGIKTLTIDEVSHDYLEIAYAGEDKLYIPSDQIYLVSKYLGGDVKLPPLTRLQSSDWVRTKKRVRQSVERIAQELLKVYATRETIKTEPFLPYESWEADLASTFPYEETPDQDQAIVDALNDLERGKLMDRLIAGDVGYGKTEVAIRTAFRTVMAGKQVAILVPTTILAFQHFNTFNERMRGFPVKVEMLSRFRSKKEQKEVIEGLKKGDIDIVIGTHRLLSEDVQFKDLGLLVIDEEHRFGVLQKEKIRQLRNDTHVLSLSATPIPRTLQMSLLGIKDTSVMETPPANRHPVHTIVTHYSPEIVRQAIESELARNGQVFFVDNRIRYLPRYLKELQELVPEAKIAVAHGEMDEETLERVMWDFAQGKYDILLSTAIIESGIDIPQANTLIVADAQNLGLAQLYQLRGRVGRSNVHAYAYFLYPKAKMLSEEAEKRLETIRDFAQLGTGLKLAMRDLEIRGAGNILGKEQHGFIVQVGYNLYRQMLEETIEKIKSGKEVLTPHARASIEINLDAYIPDSYLEGESKIEIYEKLAQVSEIDQLDKLKREIRDRYGPFPRQLENLLKVIQARLMAEELGIKRIYLEGNILYFYLEQIPSFDPSLLLEVEAKFPRRLKVEEEGFYLRLSKEEAPSALDFVFSVLLTLKENV